MAVASIAVAGVDWQHMVQLKSFTPLSMARARKREREQLNRPSHFSCSSSPAHHTSKFRISGLAWQFLVR